MRLDQATLGSSAGLWGDRQARLYQLKQGPESFPRSEELACQHKRKVSSLPLFLSHRGLLLVSFCSAAFVHVLAAEESLSASSYLWDLGPLT